MDAVAFSHIGNGRDSHEDNYLLQGEYIRPNQQRRMSPNSGEVAYSVARGLNRFLLVVSDGMGGHSSGEIASGMTVEYFSEHEAELFSEPYPQEALSKHIAALNRKVCQLSDAQKEYHGMGATLSLVLCDGVRWTAAQVGDSRIYLYTQGCLHQLSTDHTEGQRLYDLSLLTKDDLKKFPSRKALYKYIGRPGELVADVFPLSPPPVGSFLLLCSDGLTDVVSDKEIEDVLAGSGSEEEKAEQLMRIAEGRNAPWGDNITVLLARITKDGGDSR